MRYIDGVQRIPRPAATKPSPIQQGLVATPRTKPKPTTPLRPVSKRRWRIPLVAQLILAAPLLLIASFAIQSPLLGHLLIIGYGLAAFIWRVPSRTTFSMAVIAIVATIVLLITRGYLPLAQMLGSYTFLLLVVGVFTLNRELKKEGGHIYSSRQHRQY